MESAKCRNYGRGHGTAFYFNHEDPTSFLVHMKNRLKALFPEYMEGFEEGLNGAFKVRFRFMKEKKI